MSEEVYLDLVQKRALARRFQPESLADLLFPRPSSPLRIAANSAILSTAALLWARGWQGLKGLPVCFPARYARSASLCALCFFAGNEAAFGLLTKQFASDNFLASNLVGLLLGLSAATYSPRSFFGANRLMAAKFGLHLLAYGLCFDLAACGLRDKFLKRGADAPLDKEARVLEARRGAAEDSARVK